MKWAYAFALWIVFSVPAGMFLGRFMKAGKGEPCRLEKSHKEFC